MRRQSPSSLPATVPLLVACLTGTLHARAESIISSGEGRRVIGDVKSEDESNVEVEIYRGFTHKVPKAAIATRQDIDRSQRPQREDFAQRRRALGRDDIAGHLALAEWARGQGLVVQAQGMLLELAERFPDRAEIHAQAARPAAAPLGADNRDFLARQVDAFFAPDAATDAVLAALAGRDSLPPGSADEWMHLCMAAARTRGKVAEGKQKFAFGALKTTVHVELCRKARPPAVPPADDELPWPVVISLHGGGKDAGDWTMGGPQVREAFRRRLDRFIFVAPDVMRKEYAEWAGNPDEESLLKELLRAVKRTWKVDTDRVFLAGYSMGGYGTWHIGGHNADLFAGLVSGAGGILVGHARGETWGWGVVGNLMNTPIAFSHGGKDKPAPPWSDAECDRILTELAARHPDCYRHRYTFHADKGHGLPGETTAESVAWISEFTRAPYPKKICWEPKRVFNRQFSWLAVRKPQIFTRLEAEIDGQTIRLRTLNMNGGFSILLNAHLVDLDEPVTVEIDGRRVFAGLVPETLSTILTTVADRIDERQWFSARLDF
ncbi:MAG: hypothetical protein ACK6CT_00960 [Planctomycetia bacterium]|jgi:predicted esterase